MTSQTTTLKKLKNLDSDKAQSHDMLVFARYGFIQNVWISQLTIIFPIFYYANYYMIGIVRFMKNGNTLSEECIYGIWEIFIKKAFVYFRESI